MELARVTANGVLRYRALLFRAAIGRGGIRADKREGDGATPAGQLPLRRVLYRADRVARPQASVPTEPLAETDGWCDDPSHPDYNKMIHLPNEAHHEELWRSDGLYDIVGVLGWNDSPIIRGRGSAIFLHVARPDWAPTEGCVALKRDDLLSLLRAGCGGVEVS